MIKVHSLNRKVKMNATIDEPFISNHTCNAAIGVDPVPDDRQPIKGHFELRGDEAALLDELCLRIEKRLAADIADDAKPARPVTQLEALAAGA